MKTISLQKCPSCGGPLLSEVKAHDHNLYHCLNKFIFVNEDNKLDECPCFFMEIYKTAKVKVVIHRHVPINGKYYQFQNSRENSKTNLFENHKFLSSKFNPEWLILPQEDLIKKIKYWLLLK